MYELVTPVNPRAILKYTGYLLLMIGSIEIVPVLAAALLGEASAAAVYGITAVLTAVIGFAMVRLLPEFELYPKEAVVLAAIIFPLSACINAIPLAFVNGFPFLDAFFESVSGLTTTGLSVAPADVSRLFLFTRSWAQWVGGIGIVVLALLILVRPGASAFRLFEANVGETKLRPNVIGTARLLGSIYIGITIITFILLILAGMPFFDAICHAFTSVSTGGFSTRAGSIGAFPGYAVPIAIGAGCILGAVNFALYSRLEKNPRALLQSVQVRYFALFLILGIVVLTFTILGGAVTWEAFTAAAFQAMSALTTSGFSTIDIGALPETAKAALTGLMWIGGSLGSTAGGIKIIRVVVLFQLVRLVFMRFFLPSEAITPIKVRDHVVEDDQLYYLVTFVLLYSLVVIFSAFVFMLHGISMSDAIFEVSSALGTVGLSVGLTGAHLSPLLKFVLIFDMLLGRIEIIPFFILIMRKTWWRGSAGESR